MIQPITRLCGFMVMSFCVAIAQAAASPAAIELPPETVHLKPSTLAGYSIAEGKCGICHSADYVLYQPPHMTQAQWAAEMQKMQHSYGAPIGPEEIKLLAIYLADVYGDAASVSVTDRQLTLPQTTKMGPSQDTPVASNTAVGPDAQARGLLANNACLTCHALQNKVVGPAYHEIAVKYRGDPAAPAKVAANIHSGGAGKWGQVPMPPFTALSQDQLLILARFVLAQ